jgi:hypothetical protein
MMRTSGSRMKNTTMAARPPRKLRRKVFMSDVSAAASSSAWSSGAALECLAANRTGRNLPDF